MLDMYVLPFKRRESLSPEMDACFLTLALKHILKKCRVSKINLQIRGWAIVFSSCAWSEWTQFCNIKTAGSRVFLAFRFSSFLASVLVPEIETVAALFGISCYRFFFGGGVFLTIT